MSKILAFEAESCREEIQLLRTAREELCQIAADVKSAERASIVKVANDCVANERKFLREGR